MATDTEKYARICTATGEGMNEGWFLDNNYYKYQEDADKHAQTIPNEENPEQVNYKDFEELYNSFKNEGENDFCYWTEWEVEEGENYFDANGNEYNENGILVNDFFDADPESLPKEVQAILNNYTEKEGDGYENCSELVAQLEKVGYTCEYYLDAIPFNLKKM